MSAAAKTCARRLPNRIENDMNRSRLFAKLARHCFSSGREIGTDQRASRKHGVVTVFCACTILVSPFPAAADADFRALLDRLRSEQEVPGVSAVVVRGDSIVFAGGSGTADIETGLAADADTVYYIGSVTKVLTSILTLHLVEQDHVELGRPLTAIVDDLETPYPPISIYQLLTHTSGLEREGNFGYWFNARFPDGDALRAYLESTTLNAAPGERYAYSNIGYAALGLVIESVAGQSFPAALREHVLDPLNMSSTGVPGPATEVATGYTPPGRIIPSESRPFAGVGKPVGRRYERVYHDAAAMSPAFGAYSTANDMGRLARFLLGNGGDEVLTSTARQRLRARQFGGRALGGGLRRIGNRSVLSHGGWFAAHRSQLLVDTENDIAVVVLANSDDASPGDIADALYAMALGYRMDGDRDQSSSRESANSPIKADAASAAP